MALCVLIARPIHHVSVMFFYLNTNIEPHFTKAKWLTLILLSAPLFFISRSFLRFVSLIVRLHRLVYEIYALKFHPRI